MSTVPLPDAVAWFTFDARNRARLCANDGISAIPLYAGAQQAPLPEPKSDPVDLTVRSQVDRTVPEGWKLLRDTTQGERSFPEDHRHENGNYHNICCHCLRLFVGHKRRVICKVCAAPEPAEQKASQADSRSDSVDSTESAGSESTGALALRAAFYQLECANQFAARRGMAVTRDWVRGFDACIDYAIEALGASLLPQADSRSDSVDLTERSGSESTSAQALRVALAEAEETIWQLNRALREATEGETFMGEPVLPIRPSAWPWDMLPSYLIDKFEGEVITEECLQRALSDMLADPKYARAAEQADSQADSRSNQQGEGRCARALAELVRLKNISDEPHPVCATDAEFYVAWREWDARQADYKRRKPLAWAEARAAVEALKSDEGDLGVTLPAADSDSDDLAVASKAAGKTPEDHFRAACIMASALRLVRSYPDFDRDPQTGEVSVFGQVIDAALKGEIHPTLQFVGDIRNAYGSEEDGTKFF